MKRLGLFLVRVYQFIFPLIFTKTECRFKPTCSEYTYEAINQYGMIKGVWLGIKRISHCHPWYKTN